MEHVRDLHVFRLGAPHDDVEGEPLCEQFLGALKLFNAEALASRLSSSPIEPCPAPEG
jgi:hypothetical protein